MPRMTHRLPALRFKLRAFVAAIDSLDRLLGLRPTGLMPSMTHRLPALRFNLRAFVAAIDSLDRLLGLRPTATHPFPIRIPAPSTRPPPSTTWKAARRKGVSM